MKTEKCALGLYTVFPELRADVVKTLRAVAAMGYDGVELYGEMMYDPLLLRRTLHETGLEICGWHTEWRWLQEHTIRATLAYHSIVGTPNIIVPALGGPWEIGHTMAEDSEQIWQTHADELNRLSKELRLYGMRLGYHTHAHEFGTRYESGATPWSVLRKCLDRDIILELDTGSALEAGVNPAAVIAETGNRFDLIHCKPYSVQNGFETLLGAGDDGCDWPGILAQCRKTGTGWYVIECEAEHLGSRFAISDACLKNLRELLKADTVKG